MSGEQPVGHVGESRRLVRVVGRVQGVGFRAWTVRRAIQLGLRGRVRNLRDGSVEIEVCGDVGAVGRLIEVVRRGPSSALVRDVHEGTPGENPLPDGFEVGY
jgi:acylphosphatase